MTQSNSEEAYKAGFQYFKEELKLNPKEIVVDPHANLTGAAIAVFGDEVDYKTCCYFLHKHINQRAKRSGVLNETEDQNVKKLLWCLKGLAFKPKDDVQAYFNKIQQYYKRY